MSQQLPQKKRGPIRRCQSAASIALGIATLTTGAAAEYFPLEVRTQDNPVPTPPAKIVAYQQANNFAGYYESSFEYGAWVTRDTSPATPPYFVELDIPYYSNYSLANGLTISIYANDGGTIGVSPFTTPSPGTLLTQGTIDINTGYSLVTYGLPWNAANQLPASFTVSVKFDGIGGANTAGWYTSTAPTTVGSNNGLFFERDASNNWHAMNALSPVPEATTTPALAAVLIGLGLLRVRARRDR